MEKQQCFPTDDGYMVCNCIVRKGVLICSAGKWFKFLLGNKKRASK